MNPSESSEENSLDGLADLISPGLTSLLSRFRELQVHEQSAMLLLFCETWKQNFSEIPLSHSSQWRPGLLAGVTIFTDCLRLMELRLAGLDENGKDASDIAELDRIIGS